MHHVKTLEERGPIGAWAYTARVDAGLSAEEVAARLRDRGVQVHHATVRGIESGHKKPGRPLLSALAELYGVHPPRVNGQAVDDMTALVGAIERQTAAIERLLSALSPASTPTLSPEERAELDALERDVQTQRRTTPPPRHAPQTSEG